MPNNCQFSKIHPLQGGKVVYVLYTLPYCFSVSVSILASLLTVVALLRSGQLTEMQQQKLRGGRKVIVMNIG